MKQDERYRIALTEEEIKIKLKSLEIEHKKALPSEHKNVDCMMKLENEITGEIIEADLDISKRYIFFKEKDDIKIEFAFPFSIKPDYYIVLFGKEEKLSLTDFIISISAY